MHVTVFPQSSTLAIGCALAKYLPSINDVQRVYTLHSQPALRAFIVCTSTKILLNLIYTIVRETTKNFEHHSYM